MNRLNFFVKTYCLLRNYTNIPYWLLTPFRRLIRILANLFLPSYLLKCTQLKYKQNTEVIVSLTSFPARITEVWQVIECMLRQSYKPQKIVLWLSKEQFPGLQNDIPATLRERESDIFEIRFVDGDIRSHKKYYYAACEYPDSLILLIDDDIYYPTDMIENLYKAHLRTPQSVICQYGYIMRYENDGRLMSYKNWEYVNYKTNDRALFFGSGGGTLFKPSVLYKDLINIELAMKLTPKADDIWLNAMTRLADVPILMQKPLMTLPVRCKGEKIELCTENVIGGGNDIQIQSVIDYYNGKLNRHPFK